MAPRKPTSKPAGGGREKRSVANKVKKNTTPKKSSPAAPANPETSSTPKRAARGRKSTVINGVSKQAARSKTTAKSENSSLPGSDVEITPGIQNPVDDQHDWPEVDGDPLVWANCRANLADALPWYNRHQGGVHYKDDLAWGFLVDADCGVRSHIDDEIIITRVGGCSERDEKGGLIQLKDHSRDNAAVKSLLHSLELGVPVGLVIGRGNPNLRRKLSHRYNVMAFFRVASMWTERINNMKSYRIRFEKLDLSEKSWWAKKGTPPPIPYTDRIMPTPSMHQCGTCRQESVQMYREGWICLNDSCDDFWKMAGKGPPAKLTFDKKYLDFRLTPNPDIQPHHSLVPDLLSTIDENDPHVTFSPIARKGIVCPWCRKCISRIFWNGWQCTDNLQGEIDGACTFRKLLPMHPVSLRTVIDDFEMGPFRRSVYFGSTLRPSIDDQSLYPYRRVTYNLGEAGSFTHLISNKAINARRGGPDHLFQELQLTDLKLRRYPMNVAIVDGTLNAQFAANYGMPYEYVVSVQSQPFNEAPDSVLRALGRLTWAKDQVVRAEKGEAQSPNELLLLGYHEGQKINFHDDGESTLGPTITSLSLGAPATMNLRMKHKYYHGFTKGKEILIKDDPILPHCRNRENRQRLAAELAAGTMTEEEYRDAWCNSKAKERAVTPPNLISITLNHGDMVVMHGDGVQKYYEHSVKSAEKKALRFALTARHVLKDKVPVENHYKGDFCLSPDQIYNGQ
ncbi:hypothetical protein BJX99DRAFT_256831 [Aspergillus californicus]